MKKLVTLYMLSFLTCMAQDPRALIGRLQGNWHMTGSVMSTPVVYDAEGQWILDKGFFTLHMKDAATPPTYEATLFIGIDSAKNEFVVHWLDSFGGPGARVVGFGPLSAEKIEIYYPYHEGRFRNLFTYDSLKDQWKLQIESEKTNGQWSTFARYDIVRNR
jgi:hypothetical protein